MSRLPEIQILEKGCLYKVREYLCDGGYTIFSPKVTRKVINFDSYRYIPFIFAVYGRGKNAHIKIAKGINNVRVIDGNYVNRLNAKDYLKLSKLLKDKGYRFDKKTRKLINLNP
jgi:hypothetical protein